MPNRLETYRVEAYNTAKQSDNKMHDDKVARRFGFSGGNLHPFRISQGRLLSPCLT